MIQLSSELEEKLKEILLEDLDYAKLDGEAILFQYNEIGTSFFNQADNCAYIFDGKSWVKLSATSPAYSSKYPLGSSV